MARFFSTKVGVLVGGPVQICVLISLKMETKWKHECYRATSVSQFLKLRSHAMYTDNINDNNK